LERCAICSAKLKLLLAAVVVHDPQRGGVVVARQVVEVVERPVEVVSCGQRKPATAASLHPQDRAAGA
jgi:hypothetical protein